jgi:hypothetical protein
MTETDDLQLAALLRSAMPPVGTHTPSRDLWPRITMGAQRRTACSWFDLALAVAAAASFLVWPEALLLLAYHF